MPFQNNFAFGGGPRDDGFQYKLNLQPVIPFGLTHGWKIVSRMILPYIYQEKRVGSGSQSGLGDSTVTLWLSPEGGKPGVPVWGVGPVFQLPTATDAALGTEKWGIGPSAVVVYQHRGVTLGALVNHVRSFAGTGSRTDVNATFLQPFASYTTATKTTGGLNTETTYDWEAGQWLVPLNLSVTQLVKIGPLPVSFQLGGRYYAEKPRGGPDWGLRFTVALVFPK